MLQALHQTDTTLQIHTEHTKLMKIIDDENLLHIYFFQYTSLSNL